MQWYKRAAVSFNSLVLLAIAAMAAEDNAGIPLEAYGVWDRGSSFSFTEYPFLKGLSFGANWEEIEPQPGVFDWSGLDLAVQKASQHNKD